MSSSSSTTSVAAALTDPVAFDNTTAKGQPDHLFRASMKAIRRAHFRSNRIRAGLVVSGLLTDPAIYREVISVFYVLTSEVEKKQGDSQFPTTPVDQEIIQKLLSLGYAFTKDYEKDLLYLYDNDPNWKKQVQSIIDNTPAALHYRQKIQSMTKATELAGAVFVLWGALVIGGGAVAMPRIKSLCGVEATNLYTSVTGPGREERKRRFVTTWDSLVAPPPHAEPATSLFEEIVTAAQECMQCNNNVLSSVQRNPWWLKYVSIGILATALSIFYFAFGNILLQNKDESQDL